MSNPYRSRPDYAFWKTEVAAKAPMVTPFVPYKPQIDPKTKIGTAGSCFAQHIAKRLAASGYTFYVEERAPHFMSPDVAHAFGYSLFSARYGNIYTVRQLLQLVKSAETGWDPAEQPWTKGARFIDPFRPTIMPNGFARAEDVFEERQQHLRAVSRLLRNLDVFVFTLGLTEVWMTQATGAALPVCPGTSAGGTFDPKRYTFKNMTYPEVYADLLEFVELARTINPTLRFIFTVSPVPLVATMEDHSVLTSTVYSKSVLRSAVGDLEREKDYVYYFPSYEIITGNFTGGAYYESDLRNVRSEGVDHVMSVFFQTFCEAPPADMVTPVSKRGALAGGKQRLKRARSPDFVDIVCDENLLQKN